jgi:nucleoside-diphosphate-sugar epimerase
VMPRSYHRAPDRSWQFEPLATTVHGMNVFITGGTGYLGPATIAALVRAGHQVEALVRTPRDVPGATTVVGSLSDLDVLRKAATRADAVIHLAADYSGDGARVDREAAAAMLDGGGVYVHTGGVWVYGDTDGVADEDAPLNPPSIVAWREENERAVLRAGGRLVMPGVVYGGHAGLVETFFAGPLAFIGDGINRWPLVHREDIADLYVRALAAPAGARYLGVGPGEPTLREVVAALGGSTSISLEAARASMGPIADAFALDQRFTSARAREELGWTPRCTDPLGELARPR